MVERLYSNEDLANIIENEGLGYAIQYYLNPEKIEDVEVRLAWANAKVLLDWLEKKLKIEE